MQGSLQIDKSTTTKILEAKNPEDESDTPSSVEKAEQQLEEETKQEVEEEKKSD